MNILLLEDRGSTAHFLLRWLKENGHLVLGKMNQGAYNINDANSIWSQRKEVPVHCMIVDLDVPPDGLSDDQIKDAGGGCLSGWIWLRNEVLQNEPEMRSRTIIYSDYVDVLREHIPEEEYYGVTLVEKRKRDSTRIIVERINAIERILSSL